MPQVVI